MGQNSTKTNFFNEQNRFQVQSRDNEHNILYLIEKNTLQQYILKQIKANSPSQVQSLEVFINKRKLLEHQHVIQLKEFMIDKESNYIAILYAFPFRTIQEQRNERITQGIHFEQNQLWSILASLILGFSYLQSKQITHSTVRSSNIYVEQSGVIKIADPFAKQLKTNYELALDSTRLAHGIYLSPNQIDSLRQKLPVANHNPYKSDVFSLGITILQLALLSTQDNIYKNGLAGINNSEIEQSLQECNRKYSKQLTSIIRMMVIVQEKDRLDWNQLESFVKKDQASQIYQQNNPTILQSEQKVHRSQMIAKVPTITVNQTINNQPKPISQPIYFNQSGIPPNTNSIQNNYLNVKPYINNQNINQTRVVINNNQFSNQALVSNNKWLHIPSNMPVSHIPVKITFGNSNNQLVDNQKLNKVQVQYNTVVVNRPQTKIISVHQSSNIKHNFPQKNIMKSGKKITQVQITPNNVINRQITENSEKQNSIIQHILPEFLDSQNRPKKDFQSRKLPRYEGEMYKQIRHGKGRYFFENGGVYEGEWVFNRMQGFGKLYYPSGSLAYEGNWYHDRFHGKGKIYNQRPLKLSGKFDFSNFTNLDLYWITYEGNFELDMKEGKGILLLENRQSYEGSFSADMIHGEGIFKCLDNSTIKGIWQSNKLIKII